VITIADLNAVLDNQPIVDRCCCGASFDHVGPGTGNAYLAWWVEHQPCGIARLLAPLTRSLQGPEMTCPIRYEDPA
jgi:hypothetical protein